MLKNPFRSTVRYRQGFPILPGSFPLLGHLPLFYHHLLEALQEAEASLGPLFWVTPIPNYWVLIWTEPEGFELLKNKVTTSAHMKETAPVLLGDSLITRDGPPHHHVRSAVNGPFTPRGLSARGIGAVMAEVIQARVQRWARQREITVLTETQEMTLDIIFRILGIDSQELEAWRAQYRDLLFFSVLRPPGFPAHRGEKARAWIERRLLAIIAEARRRPDPEGASGGLIAAMVHGKDEAGLALSDQELLDNIRLLALAGHETTASAMAWAVIALAQEPRLWDALEAEAREAAAIPTSPQEIRRHPFAEGIFREAVRLYPPLGFTTRKTTAWVNIRDHRIPPGTILGVSLALLSRDPALYPDPDRFDPARWRGRAPTPLETCQFGGGPHFCLGYHVAWMEVVQLTLALGQEMARVGLRPRIGRGPTPRPIHYPLTHPTSRTRIVFQ